jgi:two-component system, NarL family, sensor histidine kinase UhpB
MPREEGPPLPYRAIVENSLDETALIRRDGTISYASPSVTRVLGYSPEELEGRNVFEFIHPDDLERSRPLFAGALKVQGRAAAGVVRCRHRDGSWRVIEVVGANRFDDADVGALLANFRDVTDRRTSEKELRESREQLRRLSLHISAAREEERTRIAREIHDDLGQKLTVLKMSLSRLRQDLPSEPSTLQSSLRAILKSIDELIATVRDLSTELRPAVLDHLGLVDALKWQARDFETKTGIRCEVVSRLEEVTLDSARRTDLFRVTQEALTNVARHSGASRVQVQISGEAGDLLLEISDNGQGFHEDETSRRSSLGLLGIRERIEALGGTVQWLGMAARGTRVRVRIPLIWKGGRDEEDPDRR